MSRIICICNFFKIGKTNQEELLVDYAFNEDTSESVILPALPPTELGARFDGQIKEWVIE